MFLGLHVGVSVLPHKCPSEQKFSQHDDAEDLAPFEEADQQKLVEVFFTETGVHEDGKAEVRPLADLKKNSTPYSRILCVQSTLY